jgi:hypothetical protein
MINLSALSDRFAGRGCIRTPEAPASPLISQLNHAFGVALSAAPRRDVRDYGNAGTRLQRQKYQKLRTVVPRIELCAKDMKHLEVIFCSIIECDFKVSKRANSPDDAIACVAANA